MKAVEVIQAIQGLNAKQSKALVTGATGDAVRSSLELYSTRISS